MEGELAGSYLPEKPSLIYQKAVENYFAREFKRYGYEEFPNNKLSEFASFITSKPQRLSC